jgi:hypothetical protein
MAKMFDGQWEMPLTKKMLKAKMNWLDDAFLIILMKKTA